MLRGKLRPLQPLSGLSDGIIYVFMGSFKPTWSHNVPANH